MASDEQELVEKVESAMTITKEDSPDADLGIYTSEIRGSDESGEGTYKVPYKSILQAMRRHGKEPFPTIYQDPKPESDAAKSGKMLCINEIKNLDILVQGVRKSQWYYLPIYLLYRKKVRTCGKSSVEKND